MALGGLSSSGSKIRVKITKTQVRTLLTTNLGGTNDELGKRYLDGTVF